jgi:hypothetical protein
LLIPTAIVRKVNMTRLASITNNHFSFECCCGHTSLVPVTAFIQKFELEATVDEVVAKARCSKCRLKNMAESRIVFVGGGWGGYAWHGYKTGISAIRLIITPKGSL